ncbi:ATP-dependent endonuclease [Streptomyces sp. NPDC059918]|uniref:ATP-dependent nuclease n=1 Tax=unclassified Streptomyces TaxID=2593676 RepID=UPI00366812AE
MIKDLRLKNFKAFPSFAVNFQHSSLLVGPNSAGKSTVLSALKLSETCLRLAKRSKPTLQTWHRGISVTAYPVPLRDFAALDESVRHNFRGDETSLELEWKNGAKLHVVWPELSPYVDKEPPFFYLRSPEGSTPRNIPQIRNAFSGIGVIPTLSPLEHEESILADDYVKQNQSSRLSSRHFRNQLRLLSRDGEWEDFVEFSTPWLGGLKLNKPVMRYDPANIDVFFTELGSGVEKEIVWAGDGVQIWLQLLLQLYRARTVPTLVLDEPEVFLHADLQRRLVRLLESMNSQVILATHSTEVLAEADRNSVVWVDKSRRRATRAPKPEQLNGLDYALGTAFNLAMAKALRSRGVLFVEGKDVKLLKKLARSLGQSQIAHEYSMAVVPMNGYSNWGQAEAFGWFLNEFLGKSVKAMVLLDRDYRSQIQVDAVVAKFSEVDVHAHVWAKKELESYLLIPSAIARLCKCSEGEVRGFISDILSGMERGVFARILAERQAAEKSSGRSVATITEAVMAEFDRDWQSEGFRYRACPPKEVLAQLNAKLQSEGFRAASFDAIAASVIETELADEMVTVLRRIDELAS